LAKDGDADYLITGDNDLLVLKEFGKTKIVTLREFEKEKRKKGNRKCNRKNWVTGKRANF